MLTQAQKDYIAKQEKEIDSHVAELQEALDSAPKALLSDEYPKYLIMFDSLALAWDNENNTAENVRMTGIKFATRTGRANAERLAKAIKNGNGQNGKVVFWQEAYRNEIKSQLKFKAELTETLLDLINSDAIKGFLRFEKFQAKIATAIEKG